MPINYLGDKNTILAFIIYEGLSIFWVDSIMDQYIIKGGMSLAGEVVVSGAKNAALGILAAAIMTDEEVLIDNLPDVKDINVMLEAIAQTGVYVDRINRNKVKIKLTKKRRIKLCKKQSISKE